MRAIFLPSCAVLAACLAGPSPAAAQTVYKCSADGKTSYADRPCERGPSVALPPPAAGVDAGLGSVRGDDARTLPELEKLKAAREKTALRRERSERSTERAAALRRQRCARLRLHAKWADEDLARLSARPAAKAVEAARLRARRQRESLELECPA